MKRHRLVLSVSAFYGDIEEEFHGLNEILWKKLYRKQYWNQVEGLIVREGSNFIYSRIAIGKNQDRAKADFIYVVREARHMGYFIDVDTIRWTSIDKEMRDVADFFFIKRVGVLGLPRDLRFVYRYVSPYALMNPHPRNFIVVSMRGPIGVGTFDYVEWHKKERDNLIGELGLTFERGEVPFYAEAKNKRVGDPEHGDIITRRARPKDNAMWRIAKEMNRSSRTVNVHIIEHNKSIRKRGYCLRCRRIKGAQATIEV